MQVFKSPDTTKAALGYFRDILNRVETAEVGGCIRLSVVATGVKSAPVTSPLVAIAALDGDCSISFVRGTWYKLSGGDMIRLPLTTGTLSIFTESPGGCSAYLIFAAAPNLQDQGTTANLSFLSGRRAAVLKGKYASWAEKTLPLLGCMKYRPLQNVMSLLQRAAERRRYLPFHENRSVVVPTGNGCVFQVVASGDPRLSFLTFGKDCARGWNGRSGQEGLEGVDALDALCVAGGFLSDGTSPFRDHEVVCCLYRKRIWWFTKEQSKVSRILAFFSQIGNQKVNLLTRLRSPIGPVLPLASWLHPSSMEVCKKGLAIGRLTGLDGYFCPRLLPIDRSRDGFTAEEIRNSSQGSVHQLARTCADLLTSFAFRDRWGAVYDECVSYTPEQWKAFLDRASEEMKQDRKRLELPDVPLEEACPTNNVLLHRELRGLGSLSACPSGGCHLLVGARCVKCGASVSEDRSLVPTNLERFLRTAYPTPPSPPTSKDWEMAIDDTPLLQRLADRGYVTGICPISHMQLGSSVAPTIVRLKRQVSGMLSAVRR